MSIFENNMKSSSELIDLLTSNIHSEEEWKSTITNVFFIPPHDYNVLWLKLQKLRNVYLHLFNLTFFIQNFSVEIIRHAIVSSNELLLEAILQFQNGWSIYDCIMMMV